MEELSCGHGNSNNPEKYLQLNETAVKDLVNHIKKSEYSEGSDPTRINDWIKIIDMLFEVYGNDYKIFMIYVPCMHPICRLQMCSLIDTYIYNKDIIEYTYKKDYIKKAEEEREDTQWNYLTTFNVGF